MRVEQIQNYWLKWRVKKAFTKKNNILPSLKLQRIRRMEITRMTIAASHAEGPLTEVIKSKHCSISIIIMKYRCSKRTPRTAKI